MTSKHTTLFSLRDTMLPICSYWQSAPDFRYVLLVSTLDPHLAPWCKLRDKRCTKDLLSHEPVASLSPSYFTQSWWIMIQRWIMSCVTGKMLVAASEFLDLSDVCFALFKLLFCIFCFMKVWWDIMESHELFQYNRVYWLQLTNILISQVPLRSWKKDIHKGMEV